MRNDINRDDCCYNCTDRCHACHDNCPAHAARLSRAAEKKKAIVAQKKEDHYWGCLTQYSFSTYR